MKKEKVKFYLSISPDDYNLSNDYKTEKKYDFARYYIKTQTALDFFKTDPKNRYELFNEYEKTNLYTFKKRIENNYEKYNLLKDKIENNSMLVTVEVIKNGKKLEFKERKLSDNLIKVLDTFEKLDIYNTHLHKYKEIRDQGKQQFFILEFGEEYSTESEFRNIKMLIKNTESAIKALALEEKDGEIVAKNWLEFLQENIKINKREYEYGFISHNIDSLPEFNIYQLQIIKNFDDKFMSLLGNHYEKTLEKIK